MLSKKLFVHHRTIGIRVIWRKIVIFWRHVFNNISKYYCETLTKNYKNIFLKIFVVFYWRIVLSNNNYEESLMFTRVLSVMTKLFFKISILLMCLGNPMISGIVDFANRVLNENIYVHKFVNCVYAKFKRNRVWSIAKKTSRSASLVSWT